VTDTAAWIWDGQRFLINALVGGAATQSPQVALNWTGLPGN